MSLLEDSMYHFYRSLLSEARFSDVNISGPDTGRRVLMSMPQEKETANLCFVRLEDADGVGEHAALLIQEQLAKKPDAAIVFPTGNTPLPMYSALRAGSKGLWAQS